VNGPKCSRNIFYYLNEGKKTKKKGKKEDRKKKE
jgi:hypothetical protein